MTNPTIEAALKYISGGVYPESTHLAAARCQVELLKAAGLRPDSQVLEIGGGCLVTGSLLVAMLEPGHYTAIEPNGWLVDVGRKHWKIEKPFAHVVTEHFYAGGQYDFIHSHSVLSHASASQLGEFFAAVARQLKPGGRCLASIRVGKQDTNAPAWVYPGVSFFTTETIAVTARANKLLAVHRPDMRSDMMAATMGRDFHNWIVLTHADA